MTKLIIEKNSKMDCFDNNVIAYLAKLYSFDYSFYFFKMYNIVYKRHENLLINQNLDYGDPNRITGLDALKYIYNLDYRLKYKEEFLTEDDLRSAIHQKLESGVPVAVTIDSYGCEWSHFYLDQHMYHTIMLLEYDEANDSFLTNDPYLNVPEASISFSNVYEYLSWILIIDPKEMTFNSFDSDKIDKFVKQYICTYDKKSFVEPLYQIYEDIYNYEYREEDVEYYQNPEKSYFLTRVIALSWSRYNLSQSLQRFDFYQKKDRYAAICEKLDKLAVEWEKIRNVMVFLMKLANKEKKYIFRVKQIEKIVTLIEAEENLFEDLRVLCTSF